MIRHKMKMHKKETSISANVIQFIFRVNQSVSNSSKENMRCRSYATCLKCLHFHCEFEIQKLC